MNRAEAEIKHVLGECELCRNDETRIDCDDVLCVWCPTFVQLGIDLEPIQQEE